MLEHMARVATKLGIIKSAIEGHRYREAEALLLEMQLELSRLIRDVQTAAQP